MALLPTLTPLTAIRLLLSAAVAAACMIMPGISGSMVMVLLGVYTSVLTAISDLNIPLLLPVGVGVLLGIFFGAKGINWCRNHYEQQTYFAILGLIAGSVPADFAQCRFYPGVQTVVSLFTLAAGAAIAWWMGKLEN